MPPPAFFFFSFSVQARDRRRPTDESTLPVQIAAQPTQRPPPRMLLGNPCLCVPPGGGREHGGRASRRGEEGARWRLLRGFVQEECTAVPIAGLRPRHVYPGAPRRRASSPVCRSQPACDWNECGRTKRNRGKGVRVARRGCGIEALSGRGCRNASNESARHRRTDRSNASSRWRSRRTATCLRR